MLAAALVAVWLADGCGGDDAGDELAAGTFEIGYDRDTGGPLAERDRQIVVGARIAVADVNRLGGVDQKLRLSLVPRVEGVDAVILPCAPERQADAARAAAAMRVIAIAPCNGDPTLASRFRAVWPVAVGANVQAARLAEHLHGEGEAGAAVIVDTVVPYAALLARYFRTAARRAGLAVSQADLDTVRAQPERLASLAETAPVVVAAVLPVDAAWLGRRLRAVRPGVRLAGLDTIESGRLLGRNASALDGLEFTTFGFPEPGLEVDELYEKYKALAGRRPDSSSIVLGHDAVKVVEAAIDDAGSTAFPALLEVRPGLEVGGAVGQIEYPEEGDANPSADVPLVRIEEGRPTLVDSRVPADAPPP